MSNLKNQTAAFISTYASDTSGVCSALYELGGMTVMHDASGCNSTYNTHDEPRWYDFDSYVFISALTEMEAIMGDDGKLISDIVSAAKELKPKFVAVAGTPIPMMTGFDFNAIANEIERQTGLPAFGFDTNGMHTYVSGAAKAFRAVADRFITDKLGKTSGLSVNLLGATPLDFSVNSSLQSTKELLAENGIETVSCLAMGSNLSEIRCASSARVNLVLSYSGLDAAKLLQKRFGTPYVVGRPCGAFGKRLMADIKAADRTGKNAAGFAGSSEGDILIIGEGVFAGSLAAAIREETGRNVFFASATEFDDGLLGEADVIARDEAELRPLIGKSRVLIADPLYKPLCRGMGIRFVPMPHEGFSGRIFRKDIPDLTRSIAPLLEQL